MFLEKGQVTRKYAINNTDLDKWKKLIINKDNEHKMIE